MNPNDKKDRRRKKSDSFDSFSDDNEFNRILDELERMMENAFRDFSVGNVKPGKSFVRGFNVNIGPDGKPRIQEFGDFPEQAPNGETRLSEEREPLVDIIENHRSVAITVEVPGAEKKDITLAVKDEKLEINVDRPDRKYHKNIDLPCSVNPETTKATYKNGVLDIEIEKKEKDDNKGGYEVNIV